MIEGIISNEMFPYEIEAKVRTNSECIGNVITQFQKGNQMHCMLLSHDDEKAEVLICDTNGPPDYQCINKNDFLFYPWVEDENKKMKPQGLIKCSDLPQEPQSG